MQRFIIMLAILAGCAGRRGQDTFASLRAEIGTERAKIAAQERRIAELRADLAKAQAARSAPGEERPAATAPGAPLPAVAGPTFPLGMLAPYARQDTLYAGRPPVGWGASPLAVTITNGATREVPGTSRRQPFCYLGVEIDEEQEMTVRPDRLMGAAPWVLLPVKEGSIVRSVPLIPPGGAARVVLDEAGIHSVRFRCYVGPPRPVELPDGTVVPTLQLWSEWTTTIHDTPELWVDHFRLAPVAGNAVFH